jgi:hypothetical protein
MSDLSLHLDGNRWRLWRREPEDDCCETWRAITIREVEGASGWLQRQAARDMVQRNIN